MIRDRIGDQAVATRNGLGLRLYAYFHEKDVAAAYGPYLSLHTAYMDLITCRTLPAEKSSLLTLDVPRARLGLAFWLSVAVLCQCEVPHFDFRFGYGYV